MRQLKFRIWDTLEKQYIYPENALAARHYWITLEGEVHNMQNGAGSPELVIQQWTGTQDKNGKEIYEGDILKFKTYDGWKDSFGRYVFLEVRYHELTASFRMTRGDIYRGESFDYSDKPKEVEVAGNIFESPELLKAPAIELEVHSVHVDSDGGITCYNKEGLDVEYPSVWPERIDNVIEFMDRQGIKIAR